MYFKPEKQLLLAEHVYSPFNATHENETAVKKGTVLLQNKGKDLHIM